MSNSFIDDVKAYITSQKLSVKIEAGRETAHGQYCYAHCIAHEDGAGSPCKHKLKFSTMVRLGIIYDTASVVLNCYKFELKKL